MQNDKMNFCFIKLSKSFRASDRTWYICWPAEYADYTDDALREELEYSNEFFQDGCGLNSYCQLDFKVVRDKEQIEYLLREEIKKQEQAIRNMMDRVDELEIDLENIKIQRKNEKMD